MIGHEAHKGGLSSSKLACVGGGVVTWGMASIQVMAVALLGLMERRQIEKVQQDELVDSKISAL